MSSNIVDVNSYNELKDAISQGKWARGPWFASDKDELRVKEETGATIWCFPFEQPEGRSKTCLMTGNPAEEVAIFAKMLLRKARRVEHLLRDVKDTTISTLATEAAIWVELIFGKMIISMMMISIFSPCMTKCLRWCAFLEHGTLANFREQQR
ncbi:unnamed protein product [Camellia sinensis]